MSVIKLSDLEALEQGALGCIAAEELKRMAARVLRDRTADYIKAPIAPPWADAKLIVGEWRLASPPKRAAVLDKLKAIRFTMREIRIEERTNFFAESAITAHAEVAPVRLDELTAAPESCTLNGVSRSTYGLSEEAVIKLAREAMIGLFTHELDEMLYVAGLGPDPHAGDL